VPILRFFSSGCGGGGGGGGFGGGGYILFTLLLPCERTRALFPSSFEGDNVDAGFFCIVAHFPPVRASKTLCVSCVFHSVPPPGELFPPLLPGDVPLSPMVNIASPVLEFLSTLMGSLRVYREDSSFIIFPLLFQPQLLKSWWTAFKVYGGLRSFFLHV